MNLFKAALVFLLLLSLAVLSNYAVGKVPERFLPWSPLDLSRNDNWFEDFKLVSLRENKELCRRTFDTATAQATPVPDKPFKDGCGWHNAINLRRPAGINVGGRTMTCQLAAALTLWLQHDVQPAAQSYFGQQVARLQTYGVYACRNIRGNSRLSMFRSQHAYANAIDVAGFTLDDGRKISVQAHWDDTTASGKFLKSIHRSACKRFSMALSPDYNEAHHNHFHFDRATFSRCR